MSAHTDGMSRNDALLAARLRVGWRSAETAAAQLTERGRRFLDDRHFNVSPRTWRRWEGTRPGWPSEETALVLHDALGRWPEQLGFTPPPGWLRPGHQEQAIVPDAGFLSVTAPALMPGPLSPQQVDPALIDYFQAQLEGHYRADMLLGPHDLIGTLGPQYQLIDKLTRSATGETRRGLLRVGAANAALIGWLYQDAGDLAAAAFWRGVTQEAALRALDPHLVGYAMVNSAQVRTDLGDGAGVVDLCEAALSDDQVVPKIRIMALQQQAHGASLVRHSGRAEVDRLIDAAGGCCHGLTTNFRGGTRAGEPPVIWRCSGPRATAGSASARRRAACGNRCWRWSPRARDGTGAYTWPGMPPPPRPRGGRSRPWRSRGRWRPSRWKPDRQGCGGSCPPWSG